MLYKLLCSSFVIGIFLCFSSCQNNKKEISKTEALTAFAKLHGYVKHFHPSDESNQIDWDLFGYYGVSQISKVTNQTELKSVLSALFEPIAPTIKIDFEDELIPFDQTALVPIDGSGDFDTISWQHYGFGNGAFNTYYRSTRVNRPMDLSFVKESSETFLSFENLQIKGDSIKAEFSIKHDTVNWNTYSDFALMAKNGDWETSEELSSSSLDWVKLSLVQKISGQVSDINLKFDLQHFGELLIKDIDLYVYKNDSWELFKKVSVDEELLSSERLINKNQKYLLKINQNKEISVKSGSRETNEKGLFDQKTKLGEIYQTSIGNGLTVQIPLVLLSAGNTFPAADLNKLTILKKNLIDYAQNEFVEEGVDFKTGSLITVWNIFKHFYPNHTNVSSWDEELRLLLQKADIENSTTEELLQKLVHSLRDGHARVESETLSEKENYFYPVFFENIEDQVVITRVFSKDMENLLYSTILEIDSEPIDTILFEQSLLLSAAREGINLHNSIEYLLFRNSIDSVKMKLRSFEGDTSELYLKPNLPIGDFLTIYQTEKKLKVIDQLDEQILYIDLERIEDELLQEKINEITHSKVLIVDARTQAAAAAAKIIPHLITKKDTVKWLLIPQIIRPDQKAPLYYERSGWDLEPKNPFFQGKVYYLTDESSMSYSESIGAYFEAMPNCTIVGTPSAGTNGGINAVYLPGGYSVSWTGMKILKHDGSLHYRKGITPDIIIEPTIEGVRQDRDEVLEKAIELAKAEILNGGI